MSNKNKLVKFLKSIVTFIFLVTNLLTSISKNLAVYDFFISS